MEKNVWKEQVINGFQFERTEDIELAQQEISAIQYLEGKIEGRNPETILAVYQATLEKRLFRTPVGYCYLHELQNRMIRSGIPKEKVNPIPLYQTYNHEYRKEIKPVQTVKRKETKEKRMQQLRFSVFANILLIMLAIALFVMGLKSDHPNMINYRTAILNEYSAWEDELREREQAVREKEREYNGQSQNNDSR